MDFAKFSTYKHQLVLAVTMKISMKILEKKRIDQTKPILLINQVCPEIIHWNGIGLI